MSAPRAILLLMAAAGILGGLFNVLRTEDAIKLSRKYVPEVFLTSPNPWYLSRTYALVMGWFGILVGSAALVGSFFVDKP